MIRLNSNCIRGCHLLAVALAIAQEGHANAIDEQLPGANHISPISQVAASPGHALQGSGALLNEFTGQAAFSVPLAGISHHHGLGYGVSLSYYGGGVVAQDGTHVEFSPTSWVGLGFNLRAPYIMADHKGTRDISDDEYSLALDGLSPMKLVASETVPNEFRVITSPGLKVERFTGLDAVRLYENNVPVPGSSSPNLPPVANPKTDQSGVDFFEYEKASVRLWIVTLPSGVRYQFGDHGEGGNTHCDGPTDAAGRPTGAGNQYELCLPTVGDKVGFQPFYNQGHHAKMAHTWYLQRIQDQVLSEDHGGQFSIWFEYHKVQEWSKDPGNGSPNLGGRFGTFKLDRALYIKRIFSAVGGVKPQDPSRILQEVVFERAGKSPSDLYNPTWKNPDALFETERLSQVTVKSRGQNLRRFRLAYDATPAGKTRLTDIFEQDGVFGAERPYYRFDYNPTLPSRLHKVTDAAGREVEYTFGEVAIEGDGLVQDFNLNDLGGGVPDISDLEKPNIDYRSSFGDRYYLHVEDKDCADADQERLYEFRRQGTYWALARVFLAPQGGCGIFNMAPDGSYFTYMFNGSIRVYKVDEPIDGTGPDVHNLMASDNTYLPAASYTDADMDEFPIVVHSSGGSGLGEILPFKDWFVYWNRIQARDSLNTSKRSIRFFFRDPAGTWSQCGSLGDFNQGIDNNGQNNNAQFRQGCVDYRFPAPVPAPGERNIKTLEVRAGDDFVAVLGRRMRRNIYTEHHQDPAILSIYYFDRKTGQIKVGGKGSAGDGSGIRKSIIQVGGAGREDGRKKSGSLAYADGAMYCNMYSDHDCENNFVYNVHDWSVNGNWISVWQGNLNVGGTGPTYGQYIGHFAWDGLSLRFLRDAFHPPLDPTGRLDVFAGQGAFMEHWHTGSGFNHLRVNNLNRVRWEAPVMPDYQDVSREWIVKPSGDYLVLEKMQDLGRKDAYQSALTHADGATLYRHKYGTRAFKFYGNASGEIVEIGDGLLYEGAPLGNLMLVGDRLLGLRLWDDGGTFKTRHFVYGKLKPGAIGSGAPPQFSFSQVPPVPSSDFHSCQLNGIDLVCTGFADLGTGDGNDRAKFNGRLRFYAEKNGAIGTAATATAIVGFTVRTRGTFSNVQDGTRQDFLLDYTGATAAFNSQADVPNFPQVAKRNGLLRIRSTYAVDRLSHRLPLMDKTQHGVLLEQRVTEGATVEPATPTANDRISATTYLTEKFITSPEDGAPLKEPAYFLRALNSGGTEYYFQDYTTQVTRHTFFDPLTGSPRITVSQVGSRYHVRVTRFVHEFESSPTRPFGRPLQTAGYVFDADPCTDTDDPVAEDACSNLYRDNLAFLKAPAQQVKATASNIFVYDAFTKTLKESHEWRPAALGTTPLETLEGNLALGTWRLVSRVVSLARDNTFASSPHNQPVVVQSSGVYSSQFYGGLEGHVLASVANADTLYAAYLSGEEELESGACADCFGPFGRWRHNATVLSTEAVHSGRNSLKVTGPHGPTINLRLGRRAEFLDRKKGFLLSAWIYATANSEPAFVVEWRKNTDAEQPDPVGDEMTHDVDLVQAYIAEKGPFPLNQWVKVEHLIPYDELMNHGAFIGYPGNEDYLRIWVGKAGAAATADPVYVDDVRLHPADASFSSVNYTLSGQASSTLDGRNEPVFTVFDAWQSPVAVRRKDGKVFATGARKLLTE